MVDFAGWAMPVQYGSIIDEHAATRNHVGLFDVSHMGRFEFTGEAALAFLDRLTTRRVENAAPGKIKYSLMCQEDGTILDDVLVYNAAFVSPNASCSMVVNASNREKIANWIKQHLESFDGGSVQFADRTEETAMIAVQGPQANYIAAQLCALDPTGLDYYTGADTKIGESLGFVSRTGYTGEDGCELIVPAETALQVWEQLMDQASQHEGRAAGLGARDTLRLEAAMPLYGHELSESINAAQTGLGFAINKKDRDFIGKEAITSASQDTQLPKRIGLELEGRRAAREEAAVLLEGRTIGHVTSGTFSPTLQRPIAMAYVHPETVTPGTAVEVDIRGSKVGATIVELPFYKRDI